LVVILFVLSAGVGYAMELKQGWELTRQIRARQAERDRLKQELETLSGRISLLTSGVTSEVSKAPMELLQIVSQRTAWVELFREMSVRVPDGVWLLRIEVDSNKDSVVSRVGQAIQTGSLAPIILPKKKIQLGGFARSHQNVGQLLAALEQSPKFSSVMLKFAERRSEKTGEQVSFEISAEVS
jgi:Tfp pilus assembly protein PilN